MVKASVKFTSEVNYDILVQPGIMAELAEQLREVGLGPKVVIITDQAVNRLYGQDMENMLQAEGFVVDIVELPVGEQYKSFSTWSKIFGMLKSAGADRSTAVISLGGGVVGDQAGLIAGTWQRGMPLVQIPTTLLAQVDSSVGGKAAVNHLGMKNLIGVFKHPRLVLVDPILLSSLPEEEYAAGLAEVVKTALLAGPDFWSFLVEEQAALLGRDSAVLTSVIERCLAHKAAIVSLDPEDLGGRRVLNLGHTIGHAIEELASHTYSHGQAVSIGLCFALELSLHRGLKASVFEEARAMLLRFGLPVTAPGLDLARMLQLVQQDKKAKSGVTRWVLLPAIGQPLVTTDLPAGWQEILGRLLR